MRVRQVGDEMSRLWPAPSTSSVLPAIGRHAFTIVELLVSLGIIGLLLSLILPAITQVRSSARQTRCQNHLHQLGVAVHSFEAVHRFYPSNGWGFLWMGDPDRGVGPKQPGGWVYQSLRFLEAQPLAVLGQGQPDPVKRMSLGQLALEPLPLLRCPGRPGDLLRPRLATLDFANAAVGSLTFRTDYAINEGDFITDTPGGPNSLQEADDPKYKWTDCSGATGVSFLRSQVRPAQVIDGLSHVYLIGEKVVRWSAYEDATDPGYDAPPYTGVDLDLNRWTIEGPLPDGPTAQPRRFGSAHFDGCYFVMCDGALRMVSYLVDRQVHRSAGNRHDGGLRGP